MVKLRLGIFYLDSKSRNFRVNAGQEAPIGSNAAPLFCATWIRQSKAARIRVLELSTVGIAFDTGHTPAVEAGQFNAPTR